MRSTPLLWVLALSLCAGCSNAPAPAPVSPAEHAANDTAAAAATHLGVWYWIGTTSGTQTLAAADPARYRIDFADAGTILVQADCNRGRSEYQLAAGTLAIGPIGLTKMGCPEDSQDREFLAQLAIGGSLMLRGSWLILELSEGRGSMRFARDANAVLTP